ncbi:MAG: Pycsar system effector family protein [Candidatus Helarchaeota archaeon]
MSDEKSPPIDESPQKKGEHKVTDLYYSLNFELTRISDSKASTLIIIAGQSILITAFLLANIINLSENVIPIAIGFGLSVIFNVISISFAISALRPRTFSATTKTLQPLYSHIMRHTREQFITEFLNFHYLTKEKNDRHYAEIIYEIATILNTKMRYVFLGTRFLFFGIGILAVSIFILIIEIFLI